jgi:hypothetical protein
MEVTQPAQTVWMVLGILAALVVWFVLLFSTIVVLLRYLSRWQLLTARYPFQAPSEGFQAHYQTIMVGPVRFKRCVSIYLSQSGLGLKVSMPGFKPMTIPWGEFTAATPASFLWNKAVRLSIGNPPLTTLTLPLALYHETVAYAGPSALPEL